MHVRELIELAGWIAARAPSLLADSRTDWRRSQWAYWTASKQRAECWGRALKAFWAAEPARGPAAWLAVRPAVEEITGAEVLVRVWGAFSEARDVRRAEQVASPLVRSVLGTQLEFARRVLQVLRFGRRIPASEVARTERLRRRVERWTDLLLGRMAIDPDVAVRWAFDDARARDFAAPPRTPTLDEDPTHWRVILAACRSAFQTAFADAQPACGLQNGRTAEALGQCLGRPIAHRSPAGRSPADRPPAGRSPHPPPRPAASLPWPDRLCAIADQAEQLLAEYNR